MRLLEVVRGAKTSKEVLATVMQLGKRLKKVAVVSGVCDGFIGNRMLEQYIRQSLFLVDEGASPQQVDAALDKFGMAMGPFTMYDMAGIDVGYAIRQRRYVEKPHITYSRIADRVVEMGRLGQKTGKGWYRYEPGNRDAAARSRDRRPDRVVPRRDRGRAARDRRRARSCSAACTRWSTRARRILEEGIALRASDIDVVYLTGYGFPIRTGGPMFHAQQVGLDSVVATMKRFAGNPNADPAFWQPAPLLVEAAKNGRWPK